MWNFLWIFLFLLNEATADEAILLDTRTATSDVGWTMSKGSEWQEANSPHPDGSERRMLMVCQIREPHQNNWVRTPYIPVNGAQRVHVEFEFTIRACEDVENVATCKETFNLFYYETDRDEATSTFPPWREGDYIKVDTIAADKRFRPGSHETNFETRDIGPLTKNGIYLALQDTGACMALMHVRVYYKYCPPTVRMLSTFPRTIAGPEMSSLVEAEGTCVANSLPSIGDSPSLHCNSEGRWIVSKGSCACGPGFDSDSERTRCQACGRNYYKSTMGNQPCRRCPAYSHTRDYGATSCGCSYGYYRAQEDAVSVACTKPPSRPVSLRATVNQTWVSLMWESPLNDGGRDDVTYKVECQRCQSGYDVCTSCNEGVDYIPAKSDLVQPKVKVQDLSSFAYYKFKICALNGVSVVSSASEGSNNCATTTVETSQSTPSAVLSVGVSDVTDDSFLVTWHAPEKSNGRIERYEVVATTTDDVIGLVNYTRAEFARVGGLFPDTEYVVVVRASTSVGFGPPSVPVKTRTHAVRTTPASGQPEGGFDSLQLTVAVVGGCVIVLTIVVIAFFCRKKTHGKYKAAKLDPEKFPMFRSGTISSGSVSHKTYIDPTTYEDPNRAVVDFTKEIDLGYVTIDEVIGGGEFGEVCRGKMQSPTKKEEKDVAIKTLKSGYSTQQKLDFLGEASIMGQFDHPNVIRLEGVVTKSRPLMIITEFMENGSLDAFLRIHDGEFNVIQLVGMLRNIAAGMKYLSDMGYVHRDLAARNILVNAQLICKVSDFGLSRVLEEDSDATYTTRGGKIPIRWTAPEAITYRKFTSASDVWSFGIVMWEVMSYGERPYWGMSNQDVIQAVGTGYRLPAPMDCPQVQHTLMLECWKKGRNERPKFPQIVSSLDRMLRDPSQLKAIAGERKKNSTMTSQHAPSKIPVMSSLGDVTSSESLGGWLESIGLGGYKENFIKNGCSSLEQIIQLNESELSRIGVTESEHQTRLLHSLESMKQTPSYYAKNPPQYIGDGLTGIPV